MSSSSSSDSYHGAILGIGNPLLDISAHVPQAFLDKYGVKVNNAILAEEKHMPLYEDLVKNFPVEYIAGGATQNSIRVAQWMLQKPNATTYLGCIGKDKFGEELNHAATNDGVNVLYDLDDTHPTGTCAVLIHEKERSLVTKLEAANHFKQQHLLSPAVAAAVSRARVIYSAGFFLTVSPPSLQQLAAVVRASPDNDRKVLAINISAPFIAQFFTEPLLAALEQADFVFGNESEAEAFAVKQGLPNPTNIGEVALSLAAYKKADSRRSRVAVITQGARSTIVAQDGKLSVFDVPKISPEKIVDSNGAGDAFVGGFLSQLVQGASLAKCVEAGHYAAACIIQVSGTKLTGKPTFI